MQIDKDKIKEFLDNAIKQIRTEEDPQALNQYRKIFRESVPFSLRSYFAAYMIKAAVEGKPRARHQAGARGAIPALSEDEASTIFLSVGKNRRVFPKDIIYMIIQNSGIERAHIGEIKILDTYSFVRVLTDDAQKVIDSLSGIEYRGKKLTASFARKTEGYSPEFSRQKERDAADTSKLKDEGEGLAEKDFS